MNKKRQAIWNKSKGKCWYCGCELGEKGWHADHFHPILRHYWKSGNEMGNPELDVPENLVPSCAPCNNFKHSMDIEGYRALCYEQFENIPKYTTGARQLKRLGLIDFTPKEVVFWFEGQGLTMPSKFDLIGISKEAKEIKWRKDEQESDYYSVDMGDFLCTLKRYGNKWVAIAINYEWYELGRVDIANSPDFKLRAAQWALVLTGQTTPTA